MAMAITPVTVSRCMALAYERGSGHPTVSAPLAWMDAITIRNGERNSFKLLKNTLSNERAVLAYLYVVDILANRSPTRKNVGK